MNDRTDVPAPRLRAGRVRRRWSDGCAEALPARPSRSGPSDRLDTILHEAHEPGPVTATGGSGRSPLAGAAGRRGRAWPRSSAASGWSGQDDRPTDHADRQHQRPDLAAHRRRYRPRPTRHRLARRRARRPRTTSVTLPVYYVGPVGGDAGQVQAVPRVRPPGPARRRHRGRAGQGGRCALAIDAAALQRHRRLPPALVGRRRSAAGRPSPAAADHGRPGHGGAPDAVVGAETSRLAVQELVWTAQAAIRQATSRCGSTVGGRAASCSGRSRPTRPFTARRRPALRGPRRRSGSTAAEPRPGAAGRPAGRRHGPGDRLRGHRRLAARRGGRPWSTLGPRHGDRAAPDPGAYAVDLGSLTAGAYTFRGPRAQRQGRLAYDAPRRRDLRGHVRLRPVSASGRER